MNNEGEYSYSESSAMVSGRRELNSRGKDIGINYDSANGTHRSNINTKRKDVEKANKSIIPENEDDEEEKESNNKTKEIKEKSNRNKKKRDNLNNIHHCLGNKDNNHLHQIPFSFPLP